MGLRNYIDDKIAPHFHEGGKLEKYYVFFEMFDTMLYSPDSVTRSAAHVRDGIDLKRIMMTVWFATFPAILFGLYNTGYQANLQITEFGYDAIPGWRADLVAMLALRDQAGPCHCARRFLARVHTMRCEWNSRSMTIG